MSRLVFSFEDTEEDILVISVNTPGVEVLGQWRVSGVGDYGSVTPDLPL